MIRLKNPINRNGRIIEAGTVLALPAELEKAILNAGNAEPVTASPPPYVDKVPRAKEMRPPGKGKGR